MIVLITGGTGFIGSALIKYLIRKSKYEIRTSVRSSKYFFPSNVAAFQTGDLRDNVDWSEALTNVAVVIHAAARAHVLQERRTDSIEEFRRVNVDGTINLVKQAAAKGVKRFVFMSSIGVNGNQTTSSPFTEKHQPKPVEPYAISKFEAEMRVKQIAEKVGMEFVIVRPPLVYGPNVPGNFNLLLKCIHKGLPLPFGAIHNKRSLVALDNLVDLIANCMANPHAANQVFLAGDGNNLSTTELLKLLGRYFDKPIRLIPVPQKFVELGFKTIGRNDLAQKLCGSLEIDIRKTQNLLGWNPPFSIDEAMGKTVRHYLGNLC